ncbi:hypothetical protein IRJ41_020604, partial [Triplophysa rosa]
AVNKVTTEGLQEGERGQRVLNTTRLDIIARSQTRGSSLKLKTQTAEVVIMEFSGFEEAMKISPLTPRAGNLISLGSIVPGPVGQRDARLTDDAGRPQIPATNCSVAKINEMKRTQRRAGGQLERSEKFHRTGWLTHTESTPVPTK